MRFYEVEDRAVVWFDPSNAIVFDAGSWRKSSVSFARKTMVDGSELTEGGFWRTFPAAAAQLPESPNGVVNDSTDFRTADRVRTILADVRPLAAEYYRLTGKPLGVTGEVAEYVAAEILGLELAPPRTAGFDAIRRTPSGPQRIQIKGRAYGQDAKPGQRLGTIKKAAECDAVILVLLDNTTLEPREIWEAPYSAVEARLSMPGSKARDRGSLGVAEFKNLAEKIWNAG